MGRSSGMTGDDAYAILHSKISSGGGETGTTDYNALANKPKLNGVELSGEKLASAFGLPIIYYNNNEIENTPLIVSELEPGVYVSYYGALILKGYADSEEVLERRAINGVLFVYRKFQEGMTQWDTVASFLDDGLNLNQIAVTTQYPYGLSISNIAYIGGVTRGDAIEDIEALWTFQKLPQSEASPSDDKDFTTKAYVDSVASGGILNVMETTTLEEIYNAGTSGKLVVYKFSSMSEDILIFERYVKQGDTNYIFLLYPIISTVGATTIDGIRGYTITGVGTDTISTAQFQTVSMEFSQKADVVSQVDHETSDTTFTLPPNQLHTWGEIAALNLTFTEGTSGRVNEYMFSFDSGATATVLTLPEGIISDLVVEANKHYKVSVINNYLTWNSWDISGA